LGNSIMWEDPIVAEVHRAREKLAAEFNFDVKAIFADLRKRQAAWGDRLVPPPKRAEPTSDQGRNSVSPGTAPTEDTPNAKAVLDGSKKVQVI
jgi:hypothetical protein